MTSFDIIVYILSVSLGIFLTLAIIATILVIKVFKDIKSITESAKTTIENVEEITKNMKNKASGTIVSGLFAKFSERFNNKRKG
jgi:CHASE3 domain sensor protein